MALHGEESFWWFPLRRGMTDAETADFLAWVLSVHADPVRPVFHAVVERESGALVGWAGLSVPEFLPEVLPAIEVGWRLGSAYRGRGYATEAAAAALAWGFDTLGLEEIVSIHEPDNVPVGSGHGPPRLRAGVGHGRIPSRGPPAAGPEVDGRGLVGPRRGPVSAQSSTKSSRSGSLVHVQ